MILKKEFWWMVRVEMIPINMIVPYGRLCWRTLYRRIVRFTRFHSFHGLCGRKKPVKWSRYLLERLVCETIVSHIKMLWRVRFWFRAKLTGCVEGNWALSPFSSGSQCGFTTSDHSGWACGESGGEESRWAFGMENRVSEIEHFR